MPHQKRHEPKWRYWHSLTGERRRTCRLCGFTQRFVQGRWEDT